MEMSLNPTDLFLIIAGLAIILILIFLIPLLIQLRQTANRAERLIDDINHDLPAILVAMKGTVGEMKLVSERINAKVTEIDAIINTAIYAGESLLLSTKLIRSMLTPAIAQIGGVSAGLRTFFKVFRGKAKKTKGGTTR